MGAYLCVCLHRALHINLLKFSNCLCRERSATSYRPTVPCEGDLSGHLKEQGVYMFSLKGCKQHSEQVSVDTEVKREIYQPTAYSNYQTFITIFRSFEYDKLY